MDVQMPDGRIIADVPEGITHAELLRRLALHDAADTAADVGKSAVVAIPKAAVGLAGSFGDARDLVKMGKEKLSQYLPDWINGADKATTAFSPTNLVASVFPTSRDIRAPIEDYVTGKWYEPKTRAGKVADTGVQTALMMGKNWVTAPMKAAALTAGQTIGTEGAGAMTNDNPWARLIGGLLGGGAVTALDAMRSRPGVLVRDTVGKMTPEEIAAAKQMEAQAQQLGVPLMGTESMDRGHQLASAVLSSPSGNPIMEKFLRDRAKQVGPAVEGGLLSQTGPRATPNANAARAQSAAENVISGLERDRTNLVGPDYFQANRETLPQAAIDAAKAKLLAAQARAPASEATQYSSYLKDLEAPNATNAGTLDSLYKRARDAADLPINATTADKQAAAAARIASPALESATQQSQNLARGRQQFRDFTKTEIEPVTSGPVGVVAGRSGFNPAEPSPVPRVVGTVADANVARPETIRQLYTNLNRVDRQAFPGIVQTHLENQLNNAMADIRSGANPTAGAKFRQAVAGTPQEKANFEEMMRGVAKAQGRNPDDVVRGANSLLDVLERTGRTPGIGSPTAGRSDMAQTMDRTLMGDIGRTVSASPTAPWMERLSQWTARGRWADLAEILTAKDSVDRLVKLGKMKPDSLSASYTAASLLGLDRAANQ